jgi:TRAP transporter TAXI family solute receptor
MSWRGLTIREWVWLIGPWILGFAAACAAIVYFWQPAPPQSLTMATGPETGAAHRTGERYREALAKRGITLELKKTSGSLENRATLLNDESGVSAAFVQTGSATAEDAQWLAAITNVYPEPLWIFYRSPPNQPALTQASELANKKIAIGSRGSGTRRVATEIFAAYGIDVDTDANLDIGGAEAAEKLRKSEIDAMATITGEDSSLVQSLLREPEIRLLGFPQSMALSRRFPQLTPVTLSPRIIDLATNKPPQDVPLLSVTSQLMVRNDLHPALIRILAETAKDVHSGSGWFHKAGDFPRTRGTDVPIHPDAERFYASGTPFLQRHLPFWLSVWVERALMVLVPLLAIGIPAARMLPALYSWRMRERIYRWYAEVRRYDADVLDVPLTREQADGMLEKLANIERRADKVRVPLAFARELYDLKVHIEFVRKKLRKV